MQNNEPIKESEILVTGGSGRLGSVFKKMYPKAMYPSSKELDITDSNGVAEYLMKHYGRIRAIIHTAAATGIPNCEKSRQKAYDVNVMGTRNLLTTANKTLVEYFVYVSTACVFAGDIPDNNKYFEDDLPYPKHWYGWTKYMGEQELHHALQSGRKCLQGVVARTNFTKRGWDYPKAFTDRYGTYLFAEDISKAIMRLVKARLVNDINTVHICGEDVLSMYDYAKISTPEVGKISLAEYNGPALTTNMSLGTKYWTPFKINEVEKVD